MNSSDQKVVDDLLDEVNALRSKANFPVTTSDTMYEGIGDTEAIRKNVEQMARTLDVATQQAWVFQYIHTMRWQHRKLLNRLALKLFREGRVYPNRNRGKFDRNYGMYLMLALIRAGVEVYVGSDDYNMSQDKDFIELMSRRNSDDKEAIFTTPI